MRRESNSSDAASVVSFETTTTTMTTSPLIKEDTPADGKRRGAGRLRQKARRVLADMGAPPTARQDAKDGKRTLNYADPGGLVDAMSKPVRI
ncbi:hypothetical protein V2A60_000924 [Cordyceps javanica]